MNRRNRIQSVCMAAVIAALYAVLTLCLPMLSYGPVQVRFAEALTVLPFFFPEAIPGLAVGCFIANLLGSPYVLDWVFGTLATLLAALWTARLRNRWLAPLPPVLCNMVIVGAEIAWFEVGFTAGFGTAWLWNGCTVALGELICCYVLGPLLLRYLPHITPLWERVPEARRALAAPPEQAP
ncbi:MAG: QueT transporter family protein [Clostridiales bacterium]|nr:QueT transporter family protein [Clostridiales bacterium]